MINQLTIENFLETLSDQASFKFNGKLNILNFSNRQYLGSIFLRHGDVFHCIFLNQVGLKAFTFFLSKVISENNFICVAEPEVVEGINQTIFKKWNELDNYIKVFQKSYQKALKLKPIDKIKLNVNPAFIENGSEISINEFELLATISDYSVVNEIYKNCKLLDYEITISLVSLRGKQALTVKAQ